MHDEHDRAEDEGAGHHSTQIYALPQRQTYRRNLTKPDSLVSVRSLTPQFSSRPLTNTHVIRSLLPHFAEESVRFDGSYAGIACGWYQGTSIRALT